MARVEAFTGCMELILWDDSSSREVKEQMSMAVVHANSVDSNLSAEEEAEFLLWQSSTSPAAHSINSGANSFSYFSGFIVPADHRLLEESDERSYDSESRRTREDEQYFESIMWSVKEIACDFQTACNDDDDDCDIDRFPLSETWFQEDARHYDEQQKRKRALMKHEREQLRSLEKLEDLRQKQQLTMSFEKDHRRCTSLQLAGEDGRQQEVPSFPLEWIRNTQSGEDQTNRQRSNT